MTPSLKMENGVSSCGGRLVSPIIGRFCGYFTNGRSPLSKGSVTVSSASALTELKLVASAASPARFIISRLSSTGLPPDFFVETDRHQNHCRECGIGNAWVNLCFRTEGRTLRCNDS